MACRTTFDLDYFMLIHIRSRFVRVAGEANQVLRCRGPQLPRLESAMLIVAIRALHQTFVHAMMEGPVELLLLVQVAAVAQIRLFRFQQKLAFFCVVRVMAVGTTYAVLEVDGAREIAMLLSILVAVQAPGADLLRRNTLERKNLGLVAAAVDVGLPRTMARFAAMPFRAFLLVQHGHIVRGIFVALEKPFDWHVFVAGFARLGTDIERGIRLAHIALLIRLICWSLSS